MLQRFWERRKDEEGFTLIELMVVVLIIGILIAIALPTFLGARNRAQDKAAQSSLRNALAAAKTIFTDTDDYSTVSAATMLATEPSLTYDDTGADSTGASNVSLDVATTTTTDDTIDMSSLSDSGNCFYLEDISSSGTTFGKAVYAAGNCGGPDAAGAAGGW